MGEPCDNVSGAASGSDDSARRKDRRHVILVIVAFALLLIGGLAHEWIIAVWKQASHLRMQRRISRQVLAPGTVIYTEDPARIATLKSRKDYRGKRETWGADYPADAWERKYATGSFSAIHYPLDKVDLFQVHDTFGYRRISPGGIEWIVQLNQANAFDAHRDPPNAFEEPQGQRYVVLTQAAFTPVGWTLGARGICVSYLSRGVLLEASDHLTLFAPQPDPKDPSRIAVPYELNDQRGMIEGVVLDRGSVRFAVVSGPARLVDP